MTILKKYSNRTSVKTIGLLSLPLIGSMFNPAFVEAQESQKNKPNIIFILADDLGIGDVGCYGADNYKTPNIDKLASQGMRFTHAYTAPLCGPSRATILTGRHLFRTGATNQNATGLMKPSIEMMMPTYLKQAGYVTTMIGKWGQLPLNPSDFGFDDYLKFQGSGTYWNTQARGKSYLLNGVDTPLKDKEYLPDVMHKRLVAFMTENKNKPFYAYYSLSHVHAEILPTPDSKPDSKNIYADNIAYMDKLVGKLRTELERLKLNKNTILVFFGDNGTASGRADAATIGGRRLIGQKGSMLEGGSLEPLIVYWPGVTPKGKVCSDLISATDFVPTFAEIAGAQLPNDKIIDGQSFNAQLHGEKGDPRASIFVQLAKNWYVRSIDFKLNQSGELFDMSKAPFEEITVPTDTKKAAAITARKSLQAELDRLNPTGGILDTGDGTGRNANKAKRKKKIEKSDLERQIIKNIRKQTIEQAERLMSEKPVTVTASSCKRSTGGTNDFYSEGDYWWPDPARPDGPYIQKDGQTNPENFSDHRHAMIRLSEITTTLTSAWLLTGDRKYSNKALEHLNAWFVDPLTRMNPNMLYAQAIWGRFTGRGIGLIDAYHLVEVAQSAKILIDNNVIPEDQALKIKEWFNNFLNWMLTHKYGIDEMNAKNNHGTCWVVTAASMAVLTGNEDAKQMCIKRFKTILLPSQMADDGSFPQEIKRTKPFGYSLFNIDAMCNAAQLLSTPADNLFEFKTEKGQTLRKGMEYIYPFIVDKSKWPFDKDIFIWEEWPVRQSSLLFAGLAYQNKQYISTFLSLPANPKHPEVIRNLPVRHPVIWMMRTPAKNNSKK